jgi:hypothetical protein
MPISQGIDKENVEYSYVEYKKGTVGGKPVRLSTAKERVMRG